MLSKVFQRADVNFLLIKEQVPVTLVTLGRILEAGETPLHRTFLARLHQDPDCETLYLLCCHECNDRLSGTILK
ncbi:hypothetical protein CgunFtcFv8_018075 [Champsocephalus gunnari]|uniref:Uncharacterized protein n=1 Tax=Champsocephalus gunnari TaxID=52237 RepID=A0AAN8DU92_CHAGU|nr:hypothetical protein CgunFtcFv8_018075 [Champsocephalus gunnari]